MITLWATLRSNWATFHYFGHTAFRLFPFSSVSLSFKSISIFRRFFYHLMLVPSLLFDGKMCYICMIIRNMTASF